MAAKFDLMKKRIEIIKKNPDISVEMLKSLSLISDKYDFRNLELDKWYCAPRIMRFALNLNDYYHAADPYRTIAFATIVNAVTDARSGRPCDANAWKDDAPPYSSEVCTSALHICSPAAKAYIITHGDDYENICGISRGMLIKILGVLHAPK
jgi:hypothetical protein